MADGGHTFVKKTFGKPTYCHHCSDLIWGIIQIGYICEVCNFVIHDRCVSNVVTPCSGIAPCIIKNPVAHCWSEPTHHKKKFCTVCRRRLDDSPAVHCLICEYFAHLECQDFAVPDCTENATYVPGKELQSVKHQHHWREGNLPPTSKCAYCKKTCWSSECLTGYRCEWCGMTTHGGCRMYLPTECSFGVLQPIYLPPHSVSIPRTEVPIEAIIGVQVKSKTVLVRDYSCPRSISEEFSSGDTPRFKDEESVTKTDAMHASAVSGGSGTSSHYRPESTSHKSEKSDKDKTKKEKESEEKDIEMIKVFDGNNSVRRQLYRVITVPRTYTLEQLLTTALRAFHITRDPSAFYMTDLYAPSGMEDAPLQDPTPIINLTHLEGKRPAIYLRFHDKDKGYVRVYPGKLQCSLEDPFVSVPVENTTIIKDLIRDALDRFGLQDNQIQDYRCSEVLLDRGVTERILSWNERPWDIMKQLGKDSIRQMELMRFYMQHKQDPHGPNIALFVGNLPPGLSQRNYEQTLNKYVTDDNKFTSIGPIYYEYGSVVLSFEDAQKAVRAFYNLRETIIEDKKLLVMLLPNIEPSMVPPDVRPLLVFVNVKSGGCQGLELISSFRKLLNPYQVFDLDNGGPLPGLYVFRQIANYKILVCGGDGTIGWVLQCLDNVGQDSECSSPPCAIVPLGTGNDLARVLCWGSGYTGGEDPLNLLRDVIEAEEIRLDRWTVVFHPEDKPEEPALKAPSNTTGGGAQNEDNSQIFVMNNYFGIGIDADLCLDFHNAREENPNKFNSRLHNKGYYVKMGLRKIVGRKTVKDLHKELKLEVDGKVVELPPVEGIIILNILSWGSGANPWGPDKDDHFSSPNHYDGWLEIVGVTGVVHLGQIQSGIRTAMRIAQGAHIKIHLYSDMPVQVDGEPWVQSPGDVVVLKSALKATMLKKIRGKRRLTEPHISPAVLASSLSASATASAAAAQGANQINICGSAGSGLGLGQTGSASENGDRDREPTIGT
ncbi:diacylglycerol kinase theta isoform X4 [Anastrepha obliqua]|uniref:diacylglycerol kinase theta isoform X5 n=1 Tax=Anastrepha ludens TaxID=28586 RepID=UPI0023B18C00|nr:diacylglycerol kinase theta isoform X5 [Anastrepha ludens]XP_054737303.1 diacylglycerol kinase theta isoform X4 [Anastrepha obliqua]